VDIKQITELFKVLVSLISAISWPLVTVFTLVFLGKPIKKILSNVSELSLKAGGFEAIAKRQEIEAAASLGAAVAQQQAAVAEKTEAWELSESQSDNRISIENESFKIADLVSRVFHPRVIRRLMDKRILWVDDRPENNLYPRRALEALGIQVTTSTSTQDALEKLRQDNYDVVISDMGRPPDDKAGYTLLDEIQKMGINKPFIIYAVGGNLLKHKAEARQKGAYGSTSLVTELFELVISSIS
jgi:CheY-like chemotaxis protein